jgi:hypothetical protein
MMKKDHKMAYAKDISTDGKLDNSKVLKKMTTLKNKHVEGGSTVKSALSCAFEYGRELIGFDRSEAWRLKQK